MQAIESFPATDNVAVRMAVHERVCQSMGQR